MWRTVFAFLCLTRQECAAQGQGCVLFDDVNLKAWFAEKLWWLLLGLLLIVNFQVIVLFSIDRVVYVEFDDNPTRNQFSRIFWRLLTFSLLLWFFKSLSILICLLFIGSAFGEFNFGGIEFNLETVQLWWQMSSQWAFFCFNFLMQEFNQCFFACFNNEN